MYYRDYHLENYLEKQRNEENRYKEKPCPSDFPAKLRKYWKSHNLQYSHTPIQSGWIIYYSDIGKK